MEDTTIDPSSARAWITVLFTLLFVLAITFTIILLIVVFPLFLLVFKINKKRDESTSVFPIISHFHKTIILFDLFLLLSICCLVYYIVSPSKTSFMYKNRSEAFHEHLNRKRPVGPEATLQADILMIAVIGLVIYTNAHHIMLSLLAIQRFILYFYPASAKILNWKQSTTSTVWDCIFLVCCFIPVGFFLIYTILIGPTDVSKIAKTSYSFYIVLRTEHMSISRNVSFFQTFYIVINLIFFASAVLYIPIVMSIRKLEGLTTIREFKPHKYVLYQTMAVVSSKVVRFHGYSL
ncbi:hypothetical protein CRE_30379 [Caenorhabditis remanei]|uniref:Uncharacterized protein n=1 Tax=Caenorhabditis remanei TaxID=31234 RepID=E3N5Z2_CAERE|nr:hypothetical protein CRE_30379 [Caenorhabditis remanei]